MNETIQTILDRRSIRKYKSELPSRHKIEQIVQCGLYAASGMGGQSPKILVVTDKVLRDRLSRMNAAVMGMDGDPFYGAPVVLVVLVPEDAPTGVCDGSLAIGNMMLAASSLGLGSCWVHRAKEEFDSPEGKEILKELGIPENYTGVGHLILGYPEGDTPKAAPRKENRVIFAE